MTLKSFKVQGQVEATNIVDGAITASTGTDAKIEVSNVQTNASWWSMYGDLDFNITEEYGAGSVYDTDGNLYVVGTWQDPIEINNLLLLKYDTNGTLLWSKSYSQSSEQIYGESVIYDADSGHLFVLTTQEHTWFGVIEMDTNGDIIRQVHGDIEWEMTAWDLSIDSSGNLYIIGDKGTSNSQIADNQMVFKLDATELNFVWGTEFSLGSPVDEPFQGKGFGAIEYSNGYVYVTGGVNDGSDNYSYVAKLDAATGDQIWLQDSFGGEGMGLCLDESDNVYTTLMANSMVGITVISKFNSAGVFQWSRGLMYFQGGGDVDINYDNGYVYATGAVYDGSAQGPTYDGSLGAIHWAKVDAITGDVVFQQVFSNSVNPPLEDVWRFRGHDLGAIHNSKLSIAAYAFESTATTAVAANMITLQLPLTAVTTGTYGQYLISDFIGDTATFTTSFTPAVSGLTATIFTPFSTEITNITTSTLVVDNTLTSYTQIISVGSVASLNTWTFSTDGTLTLPNGATIVDTTTTLALTPNSPAQVTSLVLRSTYSAYLTADYPTEQSYQQWLYDNGYNPNDLLSTGTEGTYVSITLWDSGAYQYNQGDVDYVITGTGITAADFTPATLTGTFAAANWVSDGFSYTNTNMIMIANDAIVEGQETFTLTITTTGTYEMLNNYLRVNIADGTTSGSESGHIHLISEDMAQTSIFLGDDNKYVKVAADDQVYINVPNPNSTTTSHLWTFAADGSLTVPNYGVIKNQVNEKAVNLVASSYTQLQWTTDVGVSEENPNDTSSATNWLRVDVDGVHIETNVNTGGTSWEWDFNNDATISFPVTYINLHNGGVQSARVLQFGDTTHQAVITGPTPPAGQSAQRLIIQGQNGGDGEGGDVYVWGGDSNIDGGDIKIYAGDADGVSSGYGGYVNIAGGSGYNQGGEVNITAGSSSAYTGGDVTIRAGTGAMVNGNINLYTNNTANQWIFGSDGHLTLPTGAQIVSDVTFTGVVTFSSTATYVNSTNTVYTDNLLELHTHPTGIGGAWDVDDGNDIGFRFHYYNGTDTNAALVLANDTKYLEWYSSGTETNGAFTGTYGTFKTGSIKLNDTTSSTNVTSGALTVAGGVGVSGDVYATALYDNNRRVATLPKYYQFNFTQFAIPITSPDYLVAQSVVGVMPVTSATILTVDADTVYDFEIMFTISQTGGQGPGSTNFGFELIGGATISFITMAAGRNGSGVYNSRTNPGTASAGNSNGTYRVVGTVGFGTGGIINPYTQFAGAPAPGGSGIYMMSGTTVRLTPVGKTSTFVTTVTI